MIKQNKCKICRRFGKKLFLKGERCYTNKCALMRRNYPPGIHGLSKKKFNLSEYARELLEAQEIKKTYGIKRLEDKKEILKRLDNVVYELGFGVSRPMSRQYVSHGHILVNKKKVDIPSYKVKINDVIKLVQIKPNLKNHKAPDWLKLNKKQLL